jgi:phosphoribosyl-AMP cyclohydrolase
MGKHYLYRHIRLDSGEPFYIGVGTKPNKTYKSISSEYSRAYSKSDRNSHWRNIIGVTKYEVEILLESDDYSFIKQKEIEFIALHGRRDLGKGTLCNLTDGGEGELNRRMPTGENHAGARLLINSQTGIFYHTEKEAAFYHNMHRNTLHNMLSGHRRNKTYLTYAESEEDSNHLKVVENKAYSDKTCTEDAKAHLSKVRLGRFKGKENGKAKEVEDIATDISYDCVREAAEKLGMSYKYLCNMLNPNSKKRNTTTLRYKQND